MIEYGQLRTMNPPITFFWNGWTANHNTLLKYGWQIAANRNDYGNYVYFTLRHKKYDIYGTSQNIPLTAIMATSSITVPVTLVNKLYMHITQDPFLSTDEMESNLVGHTTIVEALEDTPPWDIFKSDRDVEPPIDIIVDPNSVESLLNRVIKLQSPKQKEIRDRIRKEALNEKYNQQVHARILSMVA